MIVVSDSGPLIHLSRIEKLDILKDFFEEIYIPEAVYRELTSSDKNLPGSKKVKRLDWIKQEEIDDETAKQLLTNRLDEGESEAILLAKKIDAQILLIDDLAGRKTGRKYDIEVMGTLGVLEQAVKKNKIQNLKEELIKLREKGFWMDDDLFQKLIED